MINAIAQSNLIFNAVFIAVLLHCLICLNLEISGIVNIWQSFALSKKCPNMEFFLVCVFPYSAQIKQHTDQKRLSI